MIILVDKCSAFAVLAFAQVVVGGPTAEPPLERVKVQVVWAPCRSVAAAVLPEQEVKIGRRRPAEMV